MSLGRLVFGVAAAASGLVMLAWPDYKNYDQLHSVLNPATGPVVVYAAAAAQVLGGIALQFRRMEGLAAVVLAAVYLVLALLYVPQIIGAPRTYDPWGNLFEHLSLAIGPALAYARLSSKVSRVALQRTGRIIFGLCSASFGVEQALHLDFTASLVPKWLPPSQTFWAVATTVFFALAALALLTNRTALLATRLLTAMIGFFGLVIWVPAVLADPRSQTNWSEAAETFAIAGSVWIFADLMLSAATGLLERAHDRV